MTTFQPLALPSLQDNYIWAFPSQKHHISVVDPGSAKVVLDYLNQTHNKLEAILITHHHYDHIQGVEALIKAYPLAKVYGPEWIKYPNSHPLHNQSTFILGNLKWQVLAVPGHTLDHLAYYQTDTQTLFCGDTLFSAGCGRIFEGTAPMLFTSLNKIAALPPQTQIYPAHEYTLSNLMFAKTVEPDNLDVLHLIEITKKKQRQGLASLPSELAQEYRVNPFLRTKEQSIQASVEKHLAKHGLSEVEVFTSLRLWKNSF